MSWYGLCRLEHTSQQLLRPSHHPHRCFGHRWGPCEAVISFPARIRGRCRVEDRSRPQPDSSLGHLVGEPGHISSGTLPAGIVGQCFRSRRSCGYKVPISPPGRSSFFDSSGYTVRMKSTRSHCHGPNFTVQVLRIPDVPQTPVRARPIFLQDPHVSPRPTNSAMPAETASPCVSANGWVS